MANNWVDSFIRIEDLKKMIEHLDDNDFITITISSENHNTNHKIHYLEDCTSIGFWELRCE